MMQETLTDGESKGTVAEVSVTCCWLCHRQITHTHHNHPGRTPFDAQMLVENRFER